MVHREVLSQFQTHFPQYKKNIDCWFPNGKDRVRVRLRNRTELVFTFHDEKDWRLETVASFIDRTMKGENRDGRSS